MANQELLNYLKQFLATGQGAAAAKKVLLGVGWSEVDIDVAIKELETTPIKEASTLPQAQGGVQPQASGFQSQAVGVEPQIRASHSKKKIIFSFAAILLVLSGGGAYAYFYVLETETPDEVLAEAFSNLSAIQSLRHEAEFIVDIPQEPNVFGLMMGSDQTKKNANFPVSVNLKTKGAFDLKNVLKLRGSESLDIGVQYGGVGVDASVDFLFRDNKFFIKPTKVPEVLTKAVGIESTLVLDKWILVDFEDLSGGSQFLGGGMVVVPQVMPSDFLISEDQARNLTLEFYKIFKVKEELPQEKIGGVDSYHYILSVDQMMLKKIFTDYWKLVAPTGEGFTAEQEAEVMEMMNTGIAEAISYMEKNITSDGLEIWISKDDRLPRRMALEMKVDDKNFGIKADFSFSVNYSGFNEPVDVLEPEGAVTFEDLMMSLGSGTGIFAEMPNPN